MKKIFLIIAVIFCCTTAFAQDEENPKNSIKDKLFAGGSFGLSFGSYTLINLSPQIGYRFNQHFASGIGLNLIYTSLKEKDAYGADYRKVVQGITGLNLFARYYPTQKFMIQIQPEGNYIFGKQIFYRPVRETYKLDTEIVPSLLAGGGLVVPTEKGVFLTTVMYDVLQKPNSPYGNRPIVNIGYNFNF
ncbi:MAG: hypothetical protein M3Y85_03905 [Bacteroidota bacterium]|nr:hypothetical protein [Bacteroidota bacterium]